MRDDKRLQKLYFKPFGPKYYENCGYIRNLAEVMSISTVEAGAYIALLLAYGFGFADDNGIVDHLTDKSIERACMWEGERGALIQCFQAAGVLTGDREDDDNPLQINDWLWVSYGAKVVKGREDARKRSKDYRDRKKAQSEIDKDS